MPYLHLRQFQNVQFCSRSRKAKILTTGIHVVFRGLKIEPDVDIEKRGRFEIGSLGRNNANSFHQFNGPATKRNRD